MVSAGIATSGGNTDYTLVGLGAKVCAPLLGRHLWVGAQAGFASMHVITYGYGGETHLVPRIAADLQARF